jgi:hypothetical protein
MDAGTAAAISALAALVSLCALVFSVSLQWWSGRPHVKVVGLVSHLMSEAGPLGHWRYCVEVRNTGSLPVVVKAVGVVYRRGWRFRRPEEFGTITHTRADSGESVPKKLEAGEDIALMTDLNAVVATHREKGVAGVWARTAAGKVYRGKNTVKLGTLKTGEA